MNSDMRIHLNNVSHTVRTSQVVLQDGVGGLAEFPEHSLMVAAPEYWADKVIHVHDERLEKILGVNYFGIPGGCDENGYKEGVSYVLFPEWYYCPKCRKFQPINKWIKDFLKKDGCDEGDEKHLKYIKHPKCLLCNLDLIPSRIITVCSKGHIDDFPWVKWVHYNNRYGPKEICSNPELYFRTGSSVSDGLEGLTVECKRCGAISNLRKAFDADAFSTIDKRRESNSFHCTGRHPWKNEVENCFEYPVTKQRSASSVYFPVSVSSLSIPPFSNEINQKIQESVAYSDAIRGLAALTTIPEDVKKNIIVSQIPLWAENISNEIGIDTNEITAVLNRRLISGDDDDNSIGSIRFKLQEYEALNGKALVHFDNPGKDGDFNREIMDISEYNIPCLTKISLIHKIRELRVLTGFSRLKPVEFGDESSSGSFVSIKKPTTKWYPAYEVRGEGIYIELDGNAINNWIASNPSVVERARTLSENYKNSFFGQDKDYKVTPKYLLLHTLSHMLIKQLSFECGYSIASLQERIYCSEIDEGAEMSGILIYTASGDSEGTLGGLVRQGRPDCFPKIFEKAIESSFRCSNDPVCSLSEGQGTDSLNLAACYSCTLIPETSCERFNTFLDRGVLIGTFKEKNIGFFTQEETKTTTPSCPSPEIQNTQFSQTIVIKNNGTSLSGLSLSEIWKQTFETVENPTDFEHSLFEDLIELSNDISLDDSPLFFENADVIPDGIHIDVDLAFPKSKVLIFVSDNEESYSKIKKCDWRCFLTSDNSISAEEIINALRRK